MELMQRQTNKQMEQKKPRNKPVPICKNIALQIIRDRLGFPKNDTWNNWLSLRKTIELDPCITPYYEHQFQVIKHLNMTGKI